MTSSYKIVPRGTILLERFVSLLRRWRKLASLVSKRSMSDVWVKHIADSTHLFSILKEELSCHRSGLCTQSRCTNTTTIVDVGSGAGFPGIVVAALCHVEALDVDVHLVEPNYKKCLFLEMVVHELGLPSKVHRLTAQDFRGATGIVPDFITARALAPLPKLLGLTWGLFGSSTKGLFVKGSSWMKEIEEAYINWSFAHSVRQPCLNGGGSIIEVMFPHLRLKHRPQGDQ